MPSHTITVKRNESKRITTYQYDRPEAVLIITDAFFEEHGQEECERVFHDWCARCREYWSRGLNAPR